MTTTNGCHTSSSSTEHEYIYKRFESLRSQIERDYFNLLSQANQIESEVNAATTENEAGCAATMHHIGCELDNFKSNLSLVQNNLEREKFYLFKSFQGLNDASSRSLIASLGDSVERLLFDKHTEFNGIELRLSELVDRWRRREDSSAPRMQRRPVNSCEAVGGGDSSAMGQLVVNEKTRSSRADFIDPSRVSSSRSRSHNNNNNNNEVRQVTHQSN